MNIHRLTLLLTFLFLHLHINGQNLVVDGAAVLLPRLTDGERDQNPAIEGMIIFNKSQKKFQGYVGGSDPIQSIPPVIGMQYDLSQYAIKFSPETSGILESVELYYEGAGVTGSLEIRSTDPCTEPTVLGYSNSVTTSPGWNTFLFTPSLAINSGNTIYIVTSSGTVTGSPSQSNNSEFQALLSNNCAVQPSEFAIKLNIQGSWVNLH